ncbi:hypothetical protein [Phaeobacter italicus]|uniref:hypothetical protein n=1 Tax=Phaeobacter italicus TaxID=481446 RepID=UPI00248E920D|nr:hypothetical protein [Phaeobacter italicus]
MEFNNYKSFSDFLGFHIRAAFCALLAAVMVTSALQNWKQPNGIEHWPQYIMLADATLLLIYSTIIFGMIILSIFQFVARLFHGTGWGFPIGLALSLVLIALEICVFFGVGYRTAILSHQFTSCLSEQC